MFICEWFNLSQRVFFGRCVTICLALVLLVLELKVFVLELRDCLYVGAGFFVLCAAAAAAA